MMHYRNINIEAENNELILKNDAGDYVIIPANKRAWVRRKLKEGCHSCIDMLVETLPTLEDYAQGGSVISNDNINAIPVKDGVPTKQLEPVTIEAKAPYWLKYLRKKEAEYPPYKEDPLDKLYPDRALRKKMIYQQEKARYLKEETAKRILQEHPYDRDKGIDVYLNSLTPVERNIVEGTEILDKISKSYLDIIEQSILGLTPSPVRFKNKQFTQKETREFDPVTGLIEGTFGYLSKPLQGLLNEAGITNFRDFEDKEYKLIDALKGKQNDAGFIMDMATDLSNFVGIGMAKQFLKSVKEGNMNRTAKIVKSSLRSIKNNYLTPKKTADRALKIASRLDYLSHLYSSRTDVMKNILKGRSITDMEFRALRINDELIRDFPDRIINEPIRKKGAIEEYEEINFYHGSPYSFDKPTVTKPFTGEGMQSWGPGLYGSESKNVVASTYAKPHFYRIKVKSEGKPLRIVNQDTEELDNFYNSLSKEEQDKVDKFIRNKLDRTNRQLRDLSSTVTDYLRFMRDELGIVGTKYRAGQLSGMKSEAYNFTIFDDNVMTIIDHPTKEINNKLREILLKQLENELKIAKNFEEKSQTLTKYALKLYRINKEMIILTTMAGIYGATAASTILYNKVTNSVMDQMKNELRQEGIKIPQNITYKELEDLYSKYIMKSSNKK